MVRSGEPIWGSARTHGVDDGAVFTFYGRGRSGPDRRGVRVRASRRGGQVVLTNARTGVTVLTSGAAVRFWAARTPQAAPKASVPVTVPARTSKAPHGAIKAAVAPRQHPGRVWLRHMTDAGLSQSETARRMGISAVTLNRLVRGRGLPTAKVTVAFAQAVGLDVHDVWQQVCDYELAQALAGTSRRRMGGQLVSGKGVG